MGKRGDQLIRAFEEPVDLIVVQHCNKIENTVVRITESLAYDPRRPRRYCIIDGADSICLRQAEWTSVLAGRSLNLSAAALYFCGN